MLPMFTTIGTTVRTVSQRLPRRLSRRLLSAVAATAMAAGLSAVAPATAALAAAHDPAGSHAPAAATTAALTTARKAPAKPAPSTATAAKTAAPASAARPAGPAPARTPALPAGQKRVCPAAKAGYVACQSIVRTAGVVTHRGLFAAGQAPSGYSPANLRSAYNLPATGGSGQTVAVVDAYDDPFAAQDLATYRRQYGLPPCTTANGCFRKVAQDGSNRYPSPDSTGGWEEEESLDLDMVSATCPGCHILLVEADDNSVRSIGDAVDEAVKLGAKYVSNSYSSDESAQETAWDSAYYDHPGVAVVAATGDNGYGGGPQYPASSPYVTAVGGTTLTPDSGTARGWDESAWDLGGSGCSGFEAKPSWQTDSGCQLRTAADVAADADPNPGVAIYDSYPNIDTALGFAQLGWQTAGGTSVATPIITSVYALAGTPLPGTNPASYPYADPSALNDITTGSNGSGCTPAYLCNAGPGYDGPTGLGTPDGVAAFTAAHGDITGTVTSASGSPLTGAVVQAGAGSVTTNSAGQYDLSVTPGSYSVTALDLSGFASQAASGVQVTAGQSVTENFSLAAASNVTLSGKVTDGSGQGWPVYAKVTLAGTTDTSYTSPYTGRYSLKVPPDGSYTVQADPLDGGYQPAQQTVTALASNLAANLRVKVNPATCSAAGYGQAASMSETFDADTVPSGWSVVTNGDPAASWQFDQPGGFGNETGGTGNYAVAYDPEGDLDSADTSLITPAINLSADPYPVLQFDYADESFLGENYAAEVDVSDNGGNTWTEVWIDTDASSNGGTAVVAMPEVGGQSAVELRFHYVYPAQYSPLGYDYWQIDNVSISGCQPSSGGLVVGQVSDGNTGRGVAGATVTAGGQSVTTMPAPGAGLYSLFFSQAGSQQITASAPGYTTAAQNVSVAQGALTKAGFTLGAGKLAVAGGPVTATAVMGGTTTATVNVTNTGTQPVHLGISTKPGGFTPQGESAGQAAKGAPLLAVPGGLALQPGSPRTPELRAKPATASDTPPVVGGSWVQMSGLPYAPYGMAAAADPVTGQVYALGGYTSMGDNKQGQAVQPNGYLLNPVSGMWTRLPAMPHARADAQAAFIGGKVYITGGYDNDNLGVPYLDVYNPATKQWSSGATPPFTYYGAASAVLDGKMYVVGGCDSGTGECGASTVQVYDPASDTWSTAAPYPIASSYLGCGAIAGQLYCAGGYSLDESTSAAYVYDPASNAWSPIASMPIDLVAGAAAAADGELLISGGATDDDTVSTNQGVAYDPASGTWSALPNAPGLTGDAAGACGFYVIGGGANTTEYAAQLPGYGDCGGENWLSASASTATVAPGQSAMVTVTLNAADPSVSQPGRYTASVQLSNDTPYGLQSVPVTLTVTPPATWGQLKGTVDAETCSGTTVALAGATVQVSGAHGTWELSADTSGSYGLWLDADNDPLTLIVSAPGYQSQATRVTLAAGAATTHNFTLSAASCG